MPPQEDWIHPHIEIRETSQRGRGMFATQLIPEGEVVIIWGGTYVNKEGADHARQEGKLVMQFDEDLFSVEDRGESDAYFINHSCDPNVWMRNSFTLETMRDIIPGEELTADYVIWETDESKVCSWECHCGSPTCRHTITGTDWKIPALQEKYKNHFIPLIMKRMKGN